MPACSTSWGSNRAQMVCAPAPVLVQLQTTPILPVFTRQTNKRSTPVRTTRFVRPAMLSSLLRRAVPRAASARAVLVASGPMRLQPTAFAGAGNVLATRLFATLSDDEMRREMDNINDAVRARRMRRVRSLALPPHSSRQPLTLPVHYLVLPCSLSRRATKSSSPTSQRTRRTSTRRPRSPRRRCKVTLRRWALRPFADRRCV